MSQTSDQACRVAINVGSSSIKASAFRGRQRVDVNLNFIGMAEQKLTEIGLGGSRSYPCAITSFAEAAGLALSRLRHMIIDASWHNPVIVAHRVKFAGAGPCVEDFDESVCDQLKTHAYLSSRHNALCLAAREAAIAHFPHARQTAVRDSIAEGATLHREADIPFSAAVVGRYDLTAGGHHGLAVGSVLRLLRESNHAEGLQAALLIHIGSGVSVTAVGRTGHRE
jgi:acetate kinase